MLCFDDVNVNCRIAFSTRLLGFDEEYKDKAMDFDKFREDISMSKLLLKDDDTIIHNNRGAQKPKVNTK